jgi:hypothetical protein
MSNIDPVTGEEITTMPSLVAPSALGASSGGLAPDVKLGVRQAVGAEMEGFKPLEGDIVSTTPLSSKVEPSSRLRELAGPTSFGYVGQNLIDERGVIVRGQYDPSKEAYSELARLSTNDRIGLQQEFAARGLYPKNYRPTGMFESADITAMQSFLRYANFAGVTTKVARPLFLSEYKATGGLGKTVRPDAKQDLDSAVDTVFRQFLARDATSEEKASFRQMAFKQKSTQAYGGAAAPNIGVAAEAYASQQFGPEAQATSAASLFDILDKKVKGLA